jgi:hypothetical protein
VGDALRDIFLEPIPGLPQEEAYFNPRFVRPQDLNSVLKLVKNLVYVATLDDKTPGGQILLRNFTKNSIERIKKDPSLFMFSKSDQFARGQEVLHLFGNNDQELVENLYENEEKLREHFLKLERKRLRSSLFKTRERKKLENVIRKKHDFHIRIPYEYELAKQQDNFVWLRHYDQVVDKNIYIFYKNYESEDVFQAEEIVDLRNEIGQTYLKDVEKPDIYMTTEERFLPETQEVNFNGKYAIQSRSLWKLSDLSRGGPFLSYIFVDEELNRLYYIEGYIDSPGVDKRDNIIELNALLHTFLTKNEYSAKNQDQKG